METVWTGIISAIAGAVAGGFIAWFLEWSHFKRNRDEQQQIAAMQIASQLRHWLVETLNVFVEESNSEPSPSYNPERDAFPLPAHIPDFPFENSLAIISLLQKNDAQKLFNSIAERRGIEIDTVNISNLLSREEAAASFEAKLAKIYVDCASIYSNLARQIGWDEVAVTEVGIEKMRTLMRQRPD